MKRWKKVTPIPPELNGYGYLWDCPVCGAVKVTSNKRPITPCIKCGFTEEDGDTDDEH